MTRTTRPVLVIVNWRDLDHPEAGGAEVVCQELARRLATRGWHVIVLAAAVGGRPSIEERDGYWIRRAGGRFTVYMHALAWLARYRRRIAAVIDSQNGIPFFSPLVIPRTTPVLMLLHHVHQDQFTSYFSPPVARLGRFLESTVSRAVYADRGVLTVSPSTRADARRRLGLRGEIWVAPPGWSVQRQHDPQRTAHPSVLCVGRLVPHKRTHLVVAAFAGVLRTHRNATLTVVGRGPERDRLIDQARALGIDHVVTFRDDLDDDSRDALLSTAWLTVNASQGEGWGLSVIEANALGVPVLAYRRPGLRDSIDHGRSGWLLDDADDLGRAISDRLTELGDPQAAATYRANSLWWADRFTWDAMTDRVAAALASEHSRLNHGPAERRVRSDAAVVVTIPSHLLPDGWQQRARDGDVVQIDSATVSVLCRGADTSSAQRLLERLGVDDDTQVTIRVAETSDLLHVHTPLRDLEHA